MRGVIRSCVVHYPDSVIVVDGLTTAQQIGGRSTFDAKFISLPKADEKVPAVSAASIAAKVYRDDLMKKLADEYPGYDFLHNVGYGTPKHIRGIAKHGLCPIHRRSYKSIKKYLVG